MAQGGVISRGAVNLLAWILPRAQLLAGAVLVAAAVSPQSPPTAVAFADPEAYTSLWSLRIGPANVIELGLLAVAAIWLFAQVGRPLRTLQASSFDAPVAVVAAGVALLALLGWARQHPDLSFAAFDVERLGLPLAGYLLVTRFFATLAEIRTLTLVLCGMLVARAVELVVVYGLLGTTSFGTGTGRSALLITEDSLLLMLPLLVAWGSLVDGRLRARGNVGILLLAAFTAAVNVLSLRRGAMLFIASGVGLRTLAVSRARLARLAIAIALAALVLYAAGPLRPLAHDIGYTVSSLLFQRSDASTTQRDAEFANLAANMRGPDWLFGNGLGATWQAYEVGSLELGSFGSNETAFVRLGWHVYGFDWLYKFGLFGILLLGAAACWVGLQIGRSVKKSAQPLRGLLWSVGLVLPAFWLLALTNLRVAMFAGVCLGICSRLVDLQRTDHSDVDTRA